MQSKIINEAKYGSLLKVHPLKGKLAWEYNPFRNYRLNKNRYRLHVVYKLDGVLYSRDKWYYSDKELSQILTPELRAVFNDSQTLLDTPALSVDKEFIKTLVPHNATDISGDIEILEKNLLTDLDSSEFEFSMDHPVDILPQESYDGSVNLILNDGVNKPRIINSRFSPTGLNTYEVVDRKGDNDTNIYDEGEQFDIDTSLYKRVNQIPVIEFKGVSTGGNLKIGNYHFYFKLSDADGNESDFVGQSGLVSLFIGSGNPKSSYTGNRDENSRKLVKFRITNIDKAYSYINVYYSRASAEDYQNMALEYKKIGKLFLISLSGNCNLVITGYEAIIDIAANDLNLTYNIVDAAKTHALTGNMLFMANVHKSDIPYLELLDLSLRFYPHPKIEPYDLKISPKYSITSSNKWYYDPKNIYSKVGYWPEELYRIGIVYIMKSGELSPVFNIRGALQITKDSKFSDIPLYLNDIKTGRKIRNYILANKESFLLENNEITSESENIILENDKGVVLYLIDDSLNHVLSLDIRPLEFEEDSLIEEISKYAKGFFFVRLRRLPIILAQGITLGVEQESHTPVIPTALGILDLVLTNLTTSHITASLEGINYVTEGFLTRYRFKFKKKKSGFWSKFGKAVLAGVLAAAVVASSLVTAGASLAVIGIVAGVVAGSTAALGATIAGIQALSLAVKLANGSTVYSGWRSKPSAGYEIKELDESRKVGGTFKDRVIIKNPNLVDDKAIICPEFSVNLAYFNSLFTGNSHFIKEVNSQPLNSYFSNKRDRHFYISGTQKTDTLGSYNTKIVGVPDNVKLIGLEDSRFRSRAGSAEEPQLFENCGNEFRTAESISSGGDDTKTISNEAMNSDLLRGIYGPYLASSEPLGTCRIVNIYMNGYSESNMLEYLSIRGNDTNPFYLISPRIDLLEDNTRVTKTNVFTISNNKTVTSWNVYSGDSYLCQFTHRLLRNFNDPTNLYNDKIVDPNTWKDNYDPNSPDKYKSINVGDLNAVLLGLWVTFPIRSTYNLNIRSIDESNIDEKAMSGHARGYYPLHPMDPDGSYKLAESSFYNQGFAKSVPEQVHFEMGDVPWIKNWFGTRIMYSDIHVNDAFKNGYRVFRPARYRDYTRQYGEITKIIAKNGNLIVILEHGIFSLPVNTLAHNADSNMVVNNVLPENPTILSSDYGSLWKDAILETPGGIYGVDTVARKIWKIDGNKVTLLSEQMVLEFLNRAITLTETQTLPVIGRTNVKILYNSFKGDVLFTFYNPKDTTTGYDEINGYDETAWSLCYSESLSMFVTFYSWIPSFMENINNIPFSFDREVSRNFSIISQTNNLITLTDPVFDVNRLTETRMRKWAYTNEDALALGLSKATTAMTGYFTTSTFNLKSNEIGILTLDKAFNPTDKPVTYTIQKDREHNYKYFEINSEKLSAPDSLETDLVGYISNLLKLSRFSYLGNGQGILLFKDLDKALEWRNLKVQAGDTAPIRLHITAKVEGGAEYTLVLYIVFKELFELWKTDFWKHGQSGIIDIKGAIKPTRWYGKVHPFEYEFIVNDNASTHKIFDNLEIISNNVMPESFHYEVVGDAYMFAPEKPRMYVRQEKTRKLYFKNGANIAYEMNYEDVIKDHDIGYHTLDEASTIFPQYYEVRDRLNLIEDEYHRLSDPSGLSDYSWMNGAEIRYYETLDEFRIVNHVLAVDKAKKGVILGNTQYKEDRFFVQVSPIVYSLKNENLDGGMKAVPIVLDFLHIPLDMINYVNTYQHGDIVLDEDTSITTDWDFSNSKECKPKDKWIRIRVRYSGSQLALISAIKTYYSISYS